MATKYRAKPITIDGLRFASQREYKRWCELKLLEKAKVISDLKFQVKFPLRGAEQSQVAVYIADFTFTENGKQVVCDAKGFKTEVYRLKKRWMKADYGIDIREV